MTEFLTAASSGLGLGSIYALLALGFVIIYKSMRVISFAQPAFMMSGAILVSYLVPTVGFVLAVIIGTLGIALLALVVERIAIRPMVGKAVFVIAIITIGVDVVVRVVAGAFVGVDGRVMGDPWGLDATRIGDVTIAHRHLAAFVTAAVIVAALFAFFRFTSLGLAMRAAALDQEAAMAQGINVGTVFAASWALAGGLAAVAGVFAATGGTLDQNLWVIALAALPVIILGGLDSLGGAVVAGLLIGVSQEVVATYHRDLFPGLDSNIGYITPYVLMLLVLLVRPYGLFGTKEIERV
ncbi:branched-chain amino acid ABC transporter permease [Nocardioides cavernaquae]|uniref:Branched-chain amino acid ABC transporter permease n=1 Tax=Nocardioides cavernaquae TaxID=2321396 RepID=A0A3A5HC41_9ACTN|nr:branched-chain amino acid ABC transporter permease [Nocardioides cavernaquae]RJS45614.1 branched-chain amino acid ABC transporter permease [Nocardioides cavernaquae]